MDEISSRVARDPSGFKPVGVLSARGWQRSFWLGSRERSTSACASSAGTIPTTSCFRAASKDTASIETAYEVPACVVTTDPCPESPPMDQAALWKNGSKGIAMNDLMKMFRLAARIIRARQRQSSIGRLPIRETTITE